MKQILPRLLIVAAVALQLVWIGMPRSGSHPVSPRVRQAISSHESSPKAVQDAAIADAERLDAADESREAILFLLGLAGVNIVLIYSFWNYGAPKAIA